MSSAPASEFGPPGSVGARSGAVEVWRIEALKPVLQTHVKKGSLLEVYSGDAYIILHTIEQGRRYDLYFWLGKDCSADEKGASTLSRRETKSWSTAAEACTQRCQRCENFRFISFSVRYQDCSWFLRCSLPLRHEVRSFRSRPVNDSIRYEEQCSSPAPYMRGGTACPT